MTWLHKRTGPPAEDLKTVEEAKEFSEKEDVVVIGFFADADSANAKVYLAAADSQDTIYFGIVTKQEVADALEAKFDSIVLFKKFDEGRATYEGEYIAEEIVKFVHAEQLPLLTVFSDQVSIMSLRYLFVSFSLSLSLSLSLCHPPTHTHTHIQTAPKIFGGDMKTHLLAFYSSKDESAEKYTTDLKAAAKEFKGDVSLRRKLCVNHSSIV